MFGKGEKVMTNGISFNVNLIAFLASLNDFFNLKNVQKIWDCKKCLCIAIYSCKIHKSNVQSMYHCFRLTKIFITFTDHKKKYKHGLHNILLNLSTKTEKAINLQWIVIAKE